MSHKENLHRLLQAAAIELLAFIRESEAQFQPDDHWVPASEIKSKLELNFVAVPKSGKQVRPNDNLTELYDLSDDFAEQRDLAASTPRQGRRADAVLLRGPDGEPRPHGPRSAPARARRGRAGAVSRLHGPPA